MEQKDLILVLQWLILSIWLKFTHLKLHYVGRSIFNHEVVPDIVTTESNLQVLSSHNSHRPFQEVYGALEDWTLQYPSEVSKLHSEKLKALRSAVSLASVKRVFLNSRITIQKWGFGFGVTLGTPGNLTTGSYLILLMDQWGLLQCELSRTWLYSVQAFLVSDVWVSVMLAHITDLRGGSVCKCKRWPWPGVSCVQSMTSGCPLFHKFSGFFGKKPARIGPLLFCPTWGMGGVLPSLFSSENCCKS